jgi:hypothetical protein
MDTTVPVTGLPLTMEEKTLTAIESFQKNYGRPLTVSEGKKTALQA